MQESYKSPLHKMTQTTPTWLWNDSASVKELTASMENGAVGATCNPVIALTVARQEIDYWGGRISALISDMDGCTEDEISWRIVEEISIRGAELLEPIFAKFKGEHGRLAIQTDPRYYRNPKAILEQGIYFSKLAKNLIVKIPVTEAGIKAIEEVTSLGISVMATVCFTVPQSLAVAEAIERGLKRAEKAGIDTTSMAPICAIMVGRLDDFLKAIAEKKGIILDPGYLEWAGVAVFKKTYALYRKRGYRTRLLSAAFRNHLHWSEFIGGDVIISPPYQWQKKFNNSDVAVVPRMDTPVDDKVTAELSKKFEDFSRAFSENGLSASDFDTYGATVRTLRQFISACTDLSSLIRDFMMPEPVK